ncbi:MAG: hypothetical protein IKE94_02960 [Aeriscardovia sp.]|nr:hypothetical protein [Aeriscardovia sp.]
MNTTPNEKERTIRIRDLFITICQRWRSLVVCFVIGAIVLGAYGWWKSGTETISTPQQAQAMGDRLGEERKGVVESYASDIISSTLQMIRQGQYNKESLLMKLDPFHLSVCEINYYIDDPAEEGMGNSKRAAIALAYQSKLQESFLGQKVTTVVEKESILETKDFYEAPQLIQIDKENVNEGILTFRVFFPEVVNAEDVNGLKDAMRTAEGKVQGEVGSHTITLIGESSFQYADQDILAMQETNSNRINDLAERIDKIKKLVTDSDEKQYLDYLLKQDSDPTNTDQAVTVKTQRHIRKKYIIVGALLGLILAAIVIIIKYIATSTIKTSKEIEENFGLQLLGSFEGNDPFYRNRKTKLDRWLRNKRNRKKGRISADEMAELIATKIKIEAEKKGLHHICLALDGKMSDNTGFLDAMIQKVGDDPSIKVIRNILEQPDDLAGMSEMDGIVLIEQTNRSDYDDLKNICALCRNYQVNVIGSIVVE